MTSRKSTGIRRRAWMAAAAALAALALGAPLAFGGGFTPKGTQPPLVRPILSPGGCASCHGDFNTASNHEPYPTWSGSMMANAARDPVFWAALDVANHDVPGVGDFCLRCHVPAGWLAGRSEPPGGSADGCGLVGNLDDPNNDFQGVSCHFCHRLLVNDAPPPGEDPVYHENAQYWIDDGDCDGFGEPCRRGPYDYPADGSSPPSHAWAFSAYHEDSSLCGNCHNVTSPANTLIDENGTDTGIPYPIERTYAEWQQSDFAQPGAGFTTCQNCHMPDETDDPAYACIDQANNHSGDLPVHRFAGGNAWIPDVLRQEYPNLGRDAAFQATRDWALEMLQNRSARVEVTAAAAVEPGGNLPVAVKVTNLTGHKLPTGYPEGRRMWLHLQVRDALGDVVWESGAYDGATGELGEDPDLKIYHTERGIWNRNGTGECDTADGGGNPIFHFVLNDCIAVDNRIPPAGFTGGNDPETRPVGYTYAETSPGSGVLVSHDVTHYSVPVPAGTLSPLAVTATLHYQTVSKEYVEFLRDEAVANNFPDDCIPRAGGTPTQSRGEILHDLWSLYDRSPPVAMGTDERAAAVVEDLLFADGFEAGDLSAWSASVGGP